MALTQVTDATFGAEVLEAGTTVLVDFWAPWCGPCRQIAPILEEIAGERSDVKIVKVNIDENPNTPTTYGVRAIPTLLVFKAGQMTQQHVGAAPKSKLLQMIDAA